MIIAPALASQAAAAAATADHYDELDLAYRRLWGEHVHHGLWRTGRETPAEAVAALSDLVGNRLGVRPGMALADIGCGYGATARRFASQGATVTGYTLSAAQAAAAPAHPGVAIRVGDWLANDLAAASQDGAYAIESSEHFADKPGFFTAAARVLKPGARLVVAAWLANPQARDWQIRHLLRPICVEGRLPSMGTAADYLAMSGGAGFSRARHEDISTQVARTWTLCLGAVARGFVSDPVLRRLALSARNRVFAVTVARLILAYRTGAMHYGVFTFMR